MMNATGPAPMAWAMYIQARRQDCKFERQLQCFFGGQTYFEYYYTASLLAMSTVLDTEYTNIVVIK